jgi:hypothetical protein
MEWMVAIAVDTHKHVHVAVALDRFGAQLDSHEVETRNVERFSVVDGEADAATLVARQARARRGDV